MPAACRIYTLRGLRSSATEQRQHRAAWGVVGIGKNVIVGPTLATTCKSLQPRSMVPSDMGICVFMGIPQTAFAAGNPCGTFFRSLDPWISAVLVNGQQQLPLLPPIFLALFCAWMLWGWCVGESSNIKWMRLWCAPTFVVTALLLAFGAGAFLGRGLTRRAIRSEVTQIMDAIHHHLTEGDPQVVMDEVSAIDMSDNPDASDFDLIRYLPVLRERLQPAGDPAEQLADTPAATDAENDAAELARQGTTPGRLWR